MMEAGSFDPGIYSPSPLDRYDPIVDVSDSGSLSGDAPIVTRISTWVAISKGAAIGIGLSSCLILFLLIGLAVYAFQTNRAHGIAKSLQEHVETELDLIISSADTSARSLYNTATLPLVCFFNFVAETIRNDFNPLAGFQTAPVNDPKKCCEDPGDPNHAKCPACMRCKNPT